MNLKIPLLCREVTYFKSLHLILIQELAVCRQLLFSIKVASNEN